MRESDLVAGDAGRARRRPTSRDPAPASVYLAPSSVERGRTALPPRWARTVPVALGAMVVALQIAYPLAPQGPGRDALTVVTVLVFFAASVTHAAVWRGRRAAVGLVVLAGGVGTLAEVVGVATGVPFGAYEYRGTLGPEVAGVPIAIPMAWAMMAYPAYCVARRLAGDSPLLGVPIGAWALVSWDLYLDPQMVAAGHWRWLGDGPALLGIPLTNYAGWLLVSLAIVGGLWALGSAQGLPRRSAARSALPPADGIPYLLYLWVWASSLLAHLAFFGLPGSAVTGGLGMGVIAVPLAWSLAREVRQRSAPRTAGLGSTGDDEGWDGGDDGEGRG